MEIIIFIAVVVGAALLWNGYVKAKKADSDQTIDNWQPPKAEDKPWPYGEKLPEGKIHVKVADVAPTAPADSEDRVEAPAPTVANVTAENKAEAVAKVKKPEVKKTAAKPSVAKKAPAKKKST
jgi:hypothetical protein